jgi:ribosomal protein S1
MKHIPRLETRQAVATIAQKQEEAERIRRDIEDAVKSGVKVQVIPFGVSAIPDNIAFSNGIRP